MTPASAFRLATLADIGGHAETLHPAAEMPMPSVMRFSNVNGVAKTGGHRAAFAARTGRPSAIVLHRLTEDVVLHGTAQYALTRGDALLLEQIVPQHHANPAPVIARLSASTPDRVSGDVLLVARYGERTWGHWIGELLPKVVLAEQIFPGRFTYAVPNAAFGPHGAGLFGVRAMESLAAYGVTRERLMLVREDRSYGFDSLYAISPVWSDYMMHPAAREALRALDVPAGPDQRLALLRGDNSRRELVNQPETLELLAALDFTHIDIGLLPFREQVAAMRGAGAVFSILGSSLSGLIYAPDGVQVISVGPQGFVDRFFYSMMQQAKGGYAEIVGPIIERDERHLRDSSFTVPLDDLAAGLTAVGLRPSQSLTKLRPIGGAFVVGTRQMQGVADALGKTFPATSTRTNLVRNGRGFPLQHSVFAYHALTGADPATRAAFHLLGYTDADLNGYFGPALKWSGGLWVLCFWHETARFLYRHRETGALVPVPFPPALVRQMSTILGPEAGADATQWPDGHGVDAKLLTTLREQFVFVGETPPPVLARNLRLILKAPPAGTRIAVLMAAERITSRDGTVRPARQANRVNTLVRQVLADFPAVEQVDMGALQPAPPPEAFTLGPDDQARIAAHLLAGPLA